MRTKNVWIWPWLGLGVVVAILLPILLERAFPLLARDWEVSHGEAEAIARERIRDLGQLPEDPYLVTEFDVSSLLEHGLDSLSPKARANVLEGRVGQAAVSWEVQVFDLGSPRSEPVYSVSIGPRGMVTELLRFLPEDQAVPPISEAAAVERAQLFLRREGIELAEYAAPQVRTEERAERTDLTVRFRGRKQALGANVEHGLEVRFAGSELLGFYTFVESPREAELHRRFQPVVLLNMIWVFCPLVLLPIVAVPFVRRYHQGEIGVNRGVQIGAVVLVAGALMLLLVARGASADWNFGALNARQTVWVAGFQLLVLFFFTLSLLSVLSWSVGESLARERGAWRLSGFDALFKGALRNRTFAWAALRGTVAGLTLAAATLALAWSLQQLGVAILTDLQLGPWWMNCDWFSLPLVLYAVAYGLFVAVFVLLLLVSAFTRRLGGWLGVSLAVILGALLTFPPLIALPMPWTVLVALLIGAAYVALFLRYGLLVSFLAYVVNCVVSGAIVFVSAADPAIQAQAWIAMLLVGLPLILSLRYLFSDEEFDYHWEDVPPHVRRIAERERQKVELETARGIQSSILPDLPPQIHGVGLAHAYLPASEVGGDFYDVLGLEDGRLAVAVGDVAGHGVSSGLVMSMAKSALAVQVSFDPEVRSVFTTLNRMVFQSARRRLLTTLCYALLDPQRREFRYASAGHLDPFRVGREGRVHALETSSYPLGVRSGFDAQEHLERLDAADTIVLLSDGVVESHAEGSDELFGFERLEESLRRHAAKDAMGMRDGILADVTAFAGEGPRADDLTILVLRLP